MNIGTFTNETFGSVRTIVEGNEIWFLGTDVATCLGYINPRDAIQKHTDCSDRKVLKYKACRESRRAELWNKNDFMDKTFINESGLYCMIFGSHLESAQEFKLWVTKIVLPSIRKNDGYILGQEDLSKDELNNLTQEIKTLSEKVAKLQKRRHELITERNKLRDLRKKQVEEANRLKRNIAQTEEIYVKLLDEYATLMDEIYETPEPEKYEAPVRFSACVTSDGFVTNVFVE